MSEPNVYQAALVAVSRLAIEWARQSKELDARAELAEGIPAVTMLTHAQMLSDHARAIRDALQGALDGAS